MPFFYAFLALFEPLYGLFGPFLTASLTFPSFVICFIAFVDVSSKNMVRKFHKNCRTSTPPPSLFLGISLKNVFLRFLLLNGNGKMDKLCETCNLMWSDSLLKSWSMFNNQLSSVWSWNDPQDLISGTMASSGMDLIPSPRPPSTWQM